MKYPLRFLGFCLLILLFILPAYAADLIVSPKALADMGINLERFNLVKFTVDGKTLVAWEKVTDPKVIKEKGAVKLHIFNFQLDKLKDHKEIILPIGEFQQFTISADQPLALASGENGTKFMLINLENGQVKTVFDGKYESPGFRCDGILLYADGNFYGVGYLFDKDRFMTYVGMVKFDLTKKGGELFSPALSKIEVEKKLGGSVAKFIYNSPNEAFFGVYKKNKLKMMGYLNGNLIPIDEGAAFSVLSAGDHRLLYCVKKAQGVYQLMVKDIVLNKSWTLAKDKPYDYLELSNPGDTAVASLFDFNDKNMSLFFATEEDYFTLKPLKALTKVPFGVLRISGNGVFYGFLNREGLHYGRIR